jgi:4-diphosphocytidyl-2-C-methyl-D-erythritol kinase
MLTLKTKAKLNLCLHVQNKRADGYHNLHSIVAFCEVGDELSFALNEQLELKVNGDFADNLQNESDNIIIKSARHLQKYCGISHGASIILHKNLPIASGIGGGSGDAAATLIALNQLWNLNLTKKELTEIGLKIGADVPVCLYGKSCLMQGIGETITPIHLENNLYAVLINPLTCISTADIFKNISHYSGELKLHTDLIATLKHNHNDLQPIAIKLCPEIEAILEFLHSQNDVLLARMSGSGATCFALCDNLESAITLSKKAKIAFPEYWVKYGKIS